MIRYLNVWKSSLSLVLFVAATVWAQSEPAWDKHRIWTPTFTGLYQIDRASGHVTWLAHQHGNPFLSVLKQGGRLYVATSRGLYYREIPHPILRASD